MMVEGGAEEAEVAEDAEGKRGGERENGRTGEGEKRRV